jgi:hypothetical protein
MIVSIIVGLLISLLLPDIDLFEFVNTAFPIIFLLVLGVIYINFDVNLQQIGIYGLASLALQNLVSNICAIALIEIRSVVFISNFLFIGLIALVYFPFIRKVSNEENLNIGKNKLFIIFPILCLVVFVFSPMLFAMEGKSVIISKILIIILDALLLFIEFDIFIENKLHNDNETLELLLRVGKEQQQLAKENIEIINRKCHDLKHQIAGLHLFTDNSEHKKYIEELEKSIMIYETITKTGNSALDIMLTEKRLLCDKYKIHLTYIVDGEKMYFMNASDVYSLFGNALDNAIEALCDVEDEAKRIINLRVTTRNKFLTIHMENYCDNQLIMIKDGLPITTKQDKNYHGFGLKSMRYVIEKYGGVLTTSVNNNMFCINMVIPMP